MALPRKGGRALTAWALWPGLVTVRLALALCLAVAMLISLPGGLAPVMAQGPVARVKAWPGDFRAAAVFSVDTEEDAANALKAARVFEEEGIRGSFYFVSELLKGHEGLVSRLRPAGEIAIHGDIHAPFANQSCQQQLDRLSQAKATLSRLSTGPVVGFRGPGLEVDLNTLLAVSAAKLSYLGTSRRWGRIPSVIEYPREPTRCGKGEKVLPARLVLLPQLLLDDYRLFFVERLSVEQALAIWKRELDQTLAAGGLFFFSSHTTPPWGLMHDKADLLRQLVRAAKSKGFWIATAAKVASWILQRDKIKVKAELNQGDRLAVKVTNQAQRPISKLAVEVHLPGKFQHINLSSSHFSTAALQYRYYKAEGRLLIVFKNLLPKKSAMIMVQDRDRQQSSSEEQVANSLRGGLR